MALAARVVHRTERVMLARVACDGVDTPRPALEPVRGDRIVVVLRGAFELRGGRRIIADPTRAFVLRDGGEHVFRHPAGGDVCLSVSGPLAARLVGDGPALRPLDAGAWARLRALSLAEPRPALDVEETLAATLGHGEEPRRDGRARALAEEVAFLVRRRLDRAPALAELARATGVSEFHLCRAFRHATGCTIGAFYRELRLRHALALVVDTRQPIVEVALATGFASHAHLTTQFRARFGMTPRRARQSGLAQSGID